MGTSFFGRVLLLSWVFAFCLTSCGKFKRASIVSERPDYRAELMISTVQQSEQSEIVVEFVAPLGQKVFLVQYRDDLDAPEWTNVSESEGGVIVSSYKNETLRYVDKQPHDEKRFYRVLMLP